MLTIQAKLSCNHKDCKASIDVTLRIVEDRLMDGALSDYYPTFTEVINPPSGWILNERMYYNSFCPLHHPKKDPNSSYSVEW